MTAARWASLALTLAGSLLAAQADARPAVAPGLQLAWLDAQGELRAVRLDAQGRADADATFAAHPQPLGSLWKLVAYAQAVEDRQPDVPYRCQGRDADKSEEAYCCSPGASIGRAEALVRSCGLYFAGARISWASPGTTLLIAPDSIRDAVARGTLGADTRVDLKQWLQWLAAWPGTLRQQAQADLLGYWVSGAGRTALPEVAGQLRLKTYTVAQPDGTRRAGASGWSSGGTPLWIGASGSSKDVVPQWATAVVHALDVSSTAAASQAPGDGVQCACVRVRYFAQYPIARIVHARRGDEAQGGMLDGDYVVHFQNGRKLAIQSRQDLRLQSTTEGPRIGGEHTLDDYVARVLDREARPEPQHAAWALAIAARSYVLSVGTMRQGCLEIDDASRTQRVAPRPATLAARQVAAATSGLVLRGGYAVAGRYHSTEGKDGVLSWAHAVAQGQAGARFTEILADAYPRASVAALGRSDAAACEPMVLAQQWLQRQQVRWQPQLVAYAGFTVPGPVQVCRLQSGNPHAHSSAGRIDVSSFDSLEQRVAMAHEYLHLGFARHPRGLDETFIENLARQLMGVQP